MTAPAKPEIRSVSWRDGYGREYQLVPKADLDAAEAVLARISGLVEDHTGRADELPAAVQRAFVRCAESGRRAVLESPEMRLADAHRNDCMQYETLIEASMDAFGVTKYGELPQAARDAVAEWKSAGSDRRAVADALGVDCDIKAILAAIVRLHADLAAHRGREIDYQRVLRQFEEVAETLGRGADSLPTIARRVVAERDHWKAECEKARGRENEAATLHDAEIAAVTLPEPDATNPAHLRWAAEMIQISRPGGNLAMRSRQRNVLADDLRSTADRLERDRAEAAEKLVGAAESVLWATGEFPSTADVQTAVSALHSAGLLRDGAA